jgi:hypothetical protein
MPISKFLRNFDIFGEQFHFSLHGQHTTKTLLGSCFTVFFYAGLIISAVWFIRDFLDTSSPDIKVSVNIAQTFVSHQLYTGGIHFIFMLRNGTNFIPVSKVTSVASISFSLVAGASATPLPLIPCSQTSWFSDFKNRIFHQTEILNFEKFGFCPQASSNGLTISYDPVTEASTDFRIDISQLASVDPTTLANVYLEQFTLQTYMNISSVDAPLELYRDRLRPLTLSPGIFKKHSHELKSIQAITNGGIIGEKVQSGIGASIHKTFEDTISTVGTEMISIRVISGLNIETNNRDYGTWFSLISNIGGISEMLAFVVTFFYSGINSYVSKKNLIRYGIMKKEESANLLENVGNPKDPEYYDYKNTFKLRMINSNVMKPKDNIDATRAAFFRDCELLALERCDIYKIIKNFGELIFLKSVFFTDAHRKLAPIVGLSLMEEMDQQLRAKNNISATEAINLLADSPEGTSDLQKEVSREFREILSAHEGLKPQESNASRISGNKSHKTVGLSEQNTNKVLLAEEKDNSPQEDLSGGDQNQSVSQVDLDDDELAKHKSKLTLPIRIDSESARKDIAA